MSNVLFLNNWYGPDSLTQMLGLVIICSICSFKGYISQCIKLQIYQYSGKRYLSCSTTIFIEHSGAMNFSSFSERSVHEVWSQ